MCFFFPISVWGKAVDFCNSRSPSSVRPDRSVTHTHNSFTHSPFTHNSYNIATHTHTCLEWHLELVKWNVSDMQKPPTKKTR